VDPLSYPLKEDLPNDEILQEGIRPVPLLDLIINLDSLLIEEVVLLIEEVVLLIEEAVDRVVALVLLKIDDLIKIVLEVVHQPVVIEDLVEIERALISLIRLKLLILYMFLIYLGAWMLKD